MPELLQRVRLIFLLPEWIILMKNFWERSRLLASFIELFSCRTLLLV
jgi:hypothetical protein